MAISEKKMQIVIDNYFKSECNVDTSIRDAFEKGFRIGVQKTANRPSGEWTYLHGSIGSYMTMSCPFCGETFNDVAEWKYNYCPNCGARMKGGAE